MFNLLCRTAASRRNSIQPKTRDQQLALVPIKHRARTRLSKFHHSRINRLHASQNAAALLFDLATVDIR
jgi:hypothetical protein